MVWAERDAVGHWWVGRPEPRLQPMRRSEVKTEGRRWKAELKKEKGRQTSPEDDIKTRDKERMSEQCKKG